MKIPAPSPAVGGIVGSVVSGEAGPLLSQKMTPLSKPPRHYRKRKIPVAKIEHGADLNVTGPDNIQTKEPGPKG